MMAAGIMDGAGEVVSVGDETVIVKGKGRSTHEIPRNAITVRVPRRSDGTDAGVDTPAQSPPERRKSARVSAGEEMPAAPASACGRSKGGDSDEEWGNSSEDSEDSSDWVSRAKYEALKRKLEQAQGRARAKKYRSKQAAAAESSSSSEDEEDPAHPLAGVEVTIKSESGLTGGAVLPDNLRDLVVEMAVDLNMPGHIVFEAMQRTIGALGGECAKTVDTPQAASGLYTHCLVETGLVLELDQARRMAEHRRRHIRDREVEVPVEGAEPRTVMEMRLEHQIRQEDWGEEEAAQRKRAEEAAVQAHREGVVENILAWKDKIDYKSSDLPDPKTIDVGEVATEEEIADTHNFACSFLWFALDGTRQGR